MEKEKTDSREPIIEENEIREDQRANIDN